jgi:hypothetical protein
VDPAADVSVILWRRKPSGEELLEVPDGKGWRLPFGREVGASRPAVEVAIDFDPARMHRWVRIDAAHPDAVRAVAEAKERQTIAHLLRDEDPR